VRIGASKSKTKEVEVSAQVNLDGTGLAKVSTGVPFLDHMLTSLASHSLIDVEVEAKGDLMHHTVEDVALCLGRAFDQALGDRLGLMRFGNARVPMDDSVALVTVDLVKRPYCAVSLKLERDAIEGMAREDVYHFVRSWAFSGQITLHMQVEYGENDHHKVEAAVKALALSLRQAVSLDPRRVGAPSSKGVM